MLHEDLISRMAGHSFTRDILQGKETIYAFDAVSEHSQNFHLESYEEENRLELGLQKDHKNFEWAEELSVQSDQIRKHITLSLKSSSNRESKIEERRESEDELKVIQSIIDDTSSLRDNNFDKHDESDISSHHCKLGMLDRSLL